jgi:hypothetical protein
MKITADTHIILRCLLDDDLKQTAAINKRVSDIYVLMNKLHEIMGRKK